MNSQLAELNPYRWKVFQVLVVEGENAGEDRYDSNLARELAFLTCCIYPA